MVDSTPLDSNPPVTVDAEGQALMERHAEWWKRKGTIITTVKGEPLGDLWLPLADGTLAEQDLDITPDMLDKDRLAGEPLEPGPLELEGDQFRHAAPYMRVPWVEALLGTPIRATIQGGSMRTLAFVEEWADWENRAVKRDEDWLGLLLQLTELMVERSGGRYAVVHTLMRGPSDLAEAVLGPELMSFSMYDHQVQLRRFLEEVTEAFIEMLKQQAVRIPTVEGGHVNPFGIWAPGTVVRTQCDATSFLSAKHYAEWYLPYDERICEAVDYSIIHLHSCSLHTVDVLLEVERPHAIQVTLESEPSGPSLEAVLPIYRKILGVKPLILDGPLTSEEVNWLQEELPLDGLCIIAREAEW
jgi:hypothetical protein